VQQPIEHRTHRSDLAEQLAPVIGGTIGYEQRAETLVAAHSDFQQIPATIGDPAELASGPRRFAGVHR